MSPLLPSAGQSQQQKQGLSASSERLITVLSSFAPNQLSLVSASFGV
jgi:hypothetical protein